MNRGQAPYAIGLDVGGTKIAGGVVGIDSGQVLPAGGFQRMLGAAVRRYWPMP